MDKFYELYKDAGLVPIEIYITGVMTLICYVGICLNTSLIYVTVKTKTLHRPCNIMIALYAFFDSFILLRYTIKFYIFLLGINFINLRTCFIIQFIPQFGASLAIILQLCIGIDRLIGVMFPIWYKLHRNKLNKYFFSINFIVSMIVTCVQYYGISLHWDKPVMCDFADTLLLPELKTFNVVRGDLLYIADIVCYSLIWVVVFCKKASSHVSEKNKRLMLSLSIIMGLEIVVVVQNMLLNYLLTPLHLDIFTIEYVTTPIIFTIHIIFNSSITPVLLICSKQYSSAFRVCFGLPTNVVAPANPVQIITR